ncbi:MAG: hypothetical protein WB507_02695 [Solirubrobacterales bacterium]
MTAIRKHLSYANVMATFAVFIAMGGGALAALRIPANSVGTRQLKRAAVTGIKVKDGSLTGADLKPGSVTGESIKAGSLSAAVLPQFGLANLLGSSGTATNNAVVELEKGDCGRYVFTANGAQAGDAVMLQGSDIPSLQHVIEGDPSITNPNQINVSICADASAAVKQAVGSVQLRFDTLR